MKRSEGDKMQQIGTSKSHSTISWCTKEAICIERSSSCWWWHDKEHRHTAHNAHNPRRLSLPTVNCDVETKTQKYVEMYLIPSKNGAFRHRHLVLRLINASIQTNSIPLEKEITSKENNNAARHKNSCTVNCDANLITNHRSMKKRVKRTIINLHSRLVRASKIYYTLHIGTQIQIVRICLIWHLADIHNRTTQTVVRSFHLIASTVQKPLHMKVFRKIVAASATTTKR